MKLGTYIFMLTYVLIFIIGACIGSFLNVVIYRLPEKKSIWKKRSNCPHCHQKLKNYDLVPIFSFIWLKAKCRGCKQKISWQYPSVELVTGLLFVFLAYHHQVGQAMANPMFFRDLVFVAGLIIIFTTDLRYYLIFDAVSIPLMVFAFLVNFFILSHSGNYFSILINLLLAGVIGSGFFALQYWISKGKWVGGGDIRLGAVMGFMLGWPIIFVALILAYVSGAVISVILLAFKIKTMKSPVPFGVFLTGSTFVALFWGQQLLAWYLTNLGL